VTAPGVEPSDGGPRFDVRLRGLLALIVKANALQYPAATYSPSGAWDTDALQELLGSWTAARLLGRGYLARHLTAAAGDERHLRRLLERDFRYHLVEQVADRRRIRLARDIRRALESGPFTRIGTGRAQDDRYHRHGCTAQRRIDLSALRRAAVGHRPPSDLAGCVAAVLDAAGTTVEFATIVDVVAWTRGLPSPGANGTEWLVADGLGTRARRRGARADDVDVTAAAAMAQLADQEAQDAASSVLARLDERLVATVDTVRRADANVTQAAAELGIAPSTVYRRLRQILSMLADALGDPDAVRHTAHIAVDAEAVTAGWSALAHLIAREAGNT
jgi:hypothetical protein